MAYKKKARPKAQLRKARRSANKASRKSGAITRGNKGAKIKKKGLVAIKKTAGGSYPVYKKGSKLAKEYRAKHKAAAPGSTYTWRGRKYKKAGPKPKTKSGNGKKKSFPRIRKWWSANRKKAAEQKKKRKTALPNR